MLDFSLFYWIMVPAAIIGGVIRGFAGFGGPLFMLPIFNLFLAPVTSVWVMMWVDLFANVQLVPEARRDASRAVIVPLTIGTLIAMPVGLYLLITSDPLLMKRVISGAILAAALVLLSGWRYRGRLGPGIYGAVGGLSGLVMGATSIAAVAPLFLSASTHTAKENRANFIIWVISGTVLLLAVLVARGTFGTAEIVPIAVLTPAYLIGIAIGSRWHRRAADQMVRRFVLSLIIAIALAGLFL